MALTAGDTLGPVVTTLYRCKTPTNYLCPCGRVARRLRYAGVDYEEVRVRVLKRDRPEIEELTGQRWVPVLVHGDEVIHHSKRIIQFVEGQLGDARGGSRSAAAGASDRQRSDASAEAASTEAT